MTTVLILKEFREHLLSLRFQVGLMLALVLVTVSAFVLSSEHRHATKEYYEGLREEDAYLSQYAHLNRLQGVLQVAKLPGSLVLVRGLQPDTGIETIARNPMPEMFPAMDFTLIVAVIMSLLAIVLGFDAVNGEKERGTLRLILTNRVRRAEVILAKWASGVAVLAFALVVSLTAGLLVVQLRAGAAWTGTEWVSVLAVAGVGLLYCAAFFAMSLAFSVLIPRSSVSVLASLLAWVFFILVLPNLSPYVAAQIVRVPAIAALERDVRFMTSEERDEIGRKEMQQLSARYAPAVVYTPREERERMMAAAPEFKAQVVRYRAEVEALWRRVNQQQQAKAKRLTESWNASARRQFELSRKISYLSPLPMVVYASTDLASTGFADSTDFNRQATAYAQALREYTYAKADAAERRNPTFDYNDFMDVSDRPRFHYTPIPLADRLHAIRYPVLALVVWNALLFAIGAAWFMRFDVR